MTLSSLHIGLHGRQVADCWPTGHLRMTRAARILTRILVLSGVFSRSSKRLKIGGHGWRDLFQMWRCHPECTGC